MKTKKLLIAGLFLATACGVAYCSTESATNAESGVKLTGVKVDHTESIDFSRFKWLKQYPQLANIESNNQTAVIDKLRTSESISQLIGPINNPYGVRDDILEQIVKMVPESNPQMLQAAIKSAYYNNLALYSNSKDDKLKNVNLFGNALFCLMILDKSTTNKDEKNITQMISSKFRDNESRSNYIHDVETKVFAWQAISSTDNNFAQNCHNGEY